MTQDQKFLAIGVYINSALYLGAIFVAGLVVGNVWARNAAIFAMGLSYIAYYVQIAALPYTAQIGATVLSIIVGVAAGLLLLVM